MFRIEDIKHMYGSEKKGESEGVEDVQYMFDESDMHLVRDGRRYSM